MKANKKIIAIFASVMMLTATSVTVFASSTYKTPSEALAGLTGRTVESVVEERTKTGDSYGAIAIEAGVQESFKSEMMEIKKDSLSQKVAAGSITQERADEIIAALEDAQANCDGTGGGAIGKKFGANFGGDKGNGAGLGSGTGGQGRGGMGLHNGSCITE